MTADNLENAPLSAGEALIDHEPNIGYETSEPSLRTIVQRYYGAHFPADEAAAFTNQYFAVLATEKAKPTEPVVTGWRDIASAPAAPGPNDDRILVTGGAHMPFEVVQPDGEWWRKRKAEGSCGVPTHWARVVLPLPTPPSQEDGK